MTYPVFSTFLPRCFVGLAPPQTITDFPDELELRQKVSGLIDDGEFALAISECCVASLTGATQDIVPAARLILAGLSAEPFHRPDNVWALVTVLANLDS